jgi:hypothetical protein
MIGPPFSFESEIPMTSSSVKRIHRENGVNPTASKVNWNAGAGETTFKGKGEVEIPGNRRSEMKREKQCNPDATATRISSEMLQVDARKP